MLGNPPERRGPHVCECETRSLSGATRSTTGPKCLAGYARLTLRSQTET